MDLSSEENQKKPRIFCNLIIRSLQKTIDDMNVKCPLMWNIRILKDFISKYHQKAIHTYKLESWSLFFGGKILKEEETLQSILQKKNLSESFVFIINIKVNYKPTEVSNLNLELEQEISSMKKLYIENGLVEDYHRKLHFLGHETLTNETNIPNLPFFSTIPIMSRTFAERVLEIKQRKDAEKIFEKPKDLNKMPNIDLNVGDDPEYRHYRWKLLTKLLVFYFFFSYMMKGNVYPHLLLFVLFIYYKIQMKDHERKIRSIQNQRINLLISNLSKKLESEGDNIPGMREVDKKASSKEKEEEKLNFEMEMKKKEPKEISFWSKYYYIFTEFLFCFIYSFFPTWYIELYIDEQSESYKAIVDIIRKKPNETEEKKDKMMEDLNTKLLNENFKNDEKKNSEEVKDGEDSIDPTDNINPENYKLIQKLQNLHKLEVLKERLSFGKNTENDQDERSDEGSSKNSEPVHYSEYRKEESDDPNKKRSRSLEFD